MRATRFTHVSIHAYDLEESTRFYVDVFGMRRVPAPDFEHPVVWLEVGDQQLHLFHRDTPGARVPPHRPRRRRLRGGLHHRPRARALRPRRVVAQRARAQRRRRADVPARPRGQPRRGQLARREHARSLGRDDHEEHRRRASAERRGDARDALSGAPRRRRSDRCRSQVPILDSSSCNMDRPAVMVGPRDGIRCIRVTAPRRSCGAARPRGLPGHLGAVHRLGDELRAGDRRPQGLPHHAAQRAHGGGAVLRRGQRLHADLRAHARGQHGPRRVLPARRLRRAAHAAQHGRRRRRGSGCRARR